MANRTAIPLMLAGVSCIAVINCGGDSSSPPPPTPAIASFSATPSWVTSGQSTTLNWSVTNATSLSIDGLGTVSGTSVQVAPKADTTYTLTASSPFGTVTAQTTVAVFRAPSVWFAPIWLS